MFRFCNNPNNVLKITNRRSATAPLMKWQIEIFGVTDEEENYSIVTDDCGLSRETILDSVHLLRDWYKKQPHLPSIDFDDRTLARMLGICKFSVETTKKKLEDKYTAASLIPELFNNRDPWSPQMSKAFELVDWAFIPKYSPENYRVEIMRFNKCDNSFDPVTYLNTAFMVAEFRLALDICAGDIYVWDMANLTMSHVIKMTPTLIKNAMFIAQRCYGTHVRLIHVLNLPPFAELVVHGMKAIMKKKISDRFFIHKTLEDFHKALPKDLIPKDLGGDYPKTCRQLADNLRTAIKSPEWRHWFVEAAKHKTDESRRIGKSETIEDDLLGLKGTFRKLDID